MSNGPEWFAPKRYGFGSGLPIAWQGWAVMVGFFAAILAASVALARHPLAMIAVIIPLCLILMLISARTTRGGWRWRWGGDD